MGWRRRVEAFFILLLELYVVTQNIVKCVDVRGRHSKHLDSSSV